MRIHIKPRLVAIAAIVLATASLKEASASLVNGGFESGTLAGWTSTAHSAGTPAFLSAHVLMHPTIALPYTGSPYSPISGRYSALLVTMSRALPPSYGDCSVDVWNVYCAQPLPFVTGGGELPTHAIAGDNGVQAVNYEPAVLARDIEVDVGQTLRWSWAAFGEAAFEGSGIGDIAWFYATNGVEGVELIARGSSATEAMIDFKTAGVWSIYFGVGQRQDPQAYSALLIDDVRIVPTPQSLSLVSVAFIALGALRIRRRYRERSLSSRTRL